MNKIINQGPQKKTPSKQYSCWAGKELHLLASSSDPREMGESLESLGGTKRDSGDQYPPAAWLLLPLPRPAQWHLAGFLPCWDVAVLLRGEDDSSFWQFPGIIWSRGCCLCLQQDLTGWGDLRLDCFFCNFFLSFFRCQRAFILLGF